jgi:hypothetical protein
VNATCSMAADLFFAWLRVSSVKTNVAIIKEVCADRPTEQVALNKYCPLMATRSRASCGIRSPPCSWPSLSC